MIVQIGKNYSLRCFQVDLSKTIANKQFTWFMTGRQLGKTWYNRMLVVDFLFRYSFRKFPFCVIVMPTQENCNTVYFQPIKEMLKDIPEPALICRGGSGKAGEIKIKRPAFGDFASVICLGVDNAKARRGLTTDLLLADEHAFFPEGVLESVYLPMTDDTYGTALITGTVNGTNHHWTLGEYHKKKHEASDPYYGYWFSTTRDGGERGYAWCDRKEEYYTARDQFHEYDKEYNCNPYACKIDTRPFYNLVNRVQDQRVDTRDLNLQFSLLADGFVSSEVKVAVDIGKFENFRSWHWIDTLMGEIVINFGKSHKGLEGLADDLMAMYGTRFNKISIIFPSDVINESVMNGITGIVNFNNYLAAKGYSVQIQPYMLEKVKCKKTLIDNAKNKFKKLKFLNDIDNTGLQHLQKVTHPQNVTTLAVDYAKFKKTVGGEDHTADAFCYMVAAQDNGVSGRQKFTIRPTTNSSRNYRGIRG